MVSRKEENCIAFQEDVVDDWSTFESSWPIRSLGGFHTATPDDDPRLTAGVYKQLTDDVAKADASERLCYKLHMSSFCRSSV